MKNLAAALLLACAPFLASAGTPFLYSQSALVYDVGRNEVLLEKNPDEVRSVASLTKLMTAMVVLDQAQALGETLTIDDADIDRLKHTSSRIPVGAELDREEMLRLALMSSENRAASALSRAYPGGQSAFIRTMNHKAHELHMTDTHFDDPTGLSPDNRSTARDIVKMAQAASHYPLIGEFTTLPRYEEEIGSRTRFYHNTDPIVARPEWDVQLAKTGYTKEAERCIVVDTDMPNGHLIIALLGARTSRARSTDLDTIRHWLNGDETPVVMPEMDYAGAPRFHHRTLAQSHRVKAWLTAYRPGPSSSTHRSSGRHPSGTRSHRAPVIG
ncbi:MAG TPA: serine hydrolase [Paraburkholderia sp.]|nr:serine hydrolase [Paraburkholderia sp.]